MHRCLLADTFKSCPPGRPIVLLAPRHGRKAPPGAAFQVPSATSRFRRVSAYSIPRPAQDAGWSLESGRRRENPCLCGPASHQQEPLPQRLHRPRAGRVICSDLRITDGIGLLPVSPDAAEGLCRRLRTPRSGRQRQPLPSSSGERASGGAETSQVRHGVRTSGQAEGSVVGIDVVTCRCRSSGLDRPWRRQTMPSGIKVPPDCGRGPRMS